LIGARSTVGGGSRARAMSTRQASCEREIDPSLQLNPTGATSATGAGFSGATVCWGAAACAAGFCKRAQPAHPMQINKTRANRIFVAPGARFQRPVIGSICSGLRHSQRTTTGHDSHRWRCPRGATGLKMASRSGEAPPELIND